MIERNLPVTQHGRYLVEPADGSASSAPRPILAGFHGYAETPEQQMERLKSIAGASNWVLLSVQGLHRFYRGRSNDVVASWMTRQNRDLAILDNCEYVARVVDNVAEQWPIKKEIAFAGFSQGAGMAYRAAVRSTLDVTGVIACGGDVPPELDRWALAQVRRAVIARGAQDELYSAEELADDERRLREAGVDVQTVTFAGGHEWTAELSAVCSAFLHKTFTRG